MSTIIDQIDNLKYFVSYAHMRNKRKEEIEKLDKWMVNQNILNNDLIKDYGTNTLYKDPEVKQIVAEQIKSAEQLYKLMEKKREDLVRFVQHGDFAISSHINDKSYLAYPSAEELKKMDGIVFHYNG